MKQTAHITLQNINPAENKQRVYHITVTGFSVRLHWGRMGNHARKKVVDFQEEAHLLRFLQAVLKKRQRNGYRMVRMSDGFPEVGALEEMSLERFDPVQLSLF